MIFLCVYLPNVAVSDFQKKKSEVRSYHCAFYCPVLSRLLFSRIILSRLVWLCLTVYGVREELVVSMHSSTRHQRLFWSPQGSSFHKQCSTATVAGGAWGYIRVRMILILYTVDGHVIGKLHLKSQALIIYNVRKAHTFISCLGWYEYEFRCVASALGRAD